MKRHLSSKRVLVSSFSCLNLLFVVVIICACIGQNFAVLTALRFNKNGEFKILQVADMHYGNGKKTACLDVLPTQVKGCSDLNTTAFIKRMIQKENPDLIVFTDHFGVLSEEDYAKLGLKPDKSIITPAPEFNPLDRKPLIMAEADSFWATQVNIGPRRKKRTPPAVRGEGSSSQTPASGHHGDEPVNSPVIDTTPPPKRQRTEEVIDVVDDDSDPRNDDRNPLGVPGDDLHQVFPGEFSMSDLFPSSSGNPFRAERESHPPRVMGLFRPALDGLRKAIASAEGVLKVDEEKLHARIRELELAVAEKSNMVDAISGEAAGLRSQRDAWAAERQKLQQELTLRETEVATFRETEAILQREAREKAEAVAGLKAKHDEVVAGLKAEHDEAVAGLKAYHEKWVVDTKGFLDRSLQKNTDAVVASLVDYTKEKGIPFDPEDYNNWLDEDDGAGDGGDGNAGGENAGEAPNTAEAHGEDMA